MRIGRGALRTALHHAAACAPRECCGVLVGDADRITDVRAARNAAAGLHEFRLDPTDLLMHLTRDGPRIIGGYHSHVAGQALSPSPADRLSAAGAGIGDYHLLISPAGDWCIYRVRGARWTPEPCELHDD